jgi:hypothetical protein
MRFRLKLKNYGLNANRSGKNGGLVPVVLEASQGEVIGIHSGVPAFASYQVV